MSPDQKNPDITVRGGLIYVTNPDKHHLPTRHQPNTPANKKKVTPRADHQPAPATPEGIKPDEPTEISQSD